MPSEKAAHPTAVLVAETSPLQRKLTGEMLDSFHISGVTFVKDSDELQETCRGQAYDLILLDYNLAKTNPLEAIPQLRSEGKNTQTPIILTYEKPPGERIENLLHQILAAGASGTLRKPVDAQAFRTLAESLTGRTLVSQPEEIKRVEESLQAARKAAALARSLHESGQPASAEQAYLGALLEILLGMAELRLAGGDPEGAGLLVREASEFAPQAPTLFQERGKHFVERGNAHLKEKRFPLARAEFAGALHLNGEDLEAQAGLIHSLYALGEKAAAADSLRRALAAPAKAEHRLAYKRFGDVALRVKEYDLAIAAYEQALAFVKTDPILFYQQALVFTAQYQFPSAMNRLNKALALRPDFPEAKQLRDKIVAWQRAAEKRGGPAKEE
ncbi:MAG: response regulator [Candidatus Tectomicrobia bacterium]|nr:response regulator [Candidatus Tectomicrobia bacterium]